MRGLDLFVFLTVASLEAAVSGDAQIRAKAGPSEIVITTTSRLAGAIHSLRWNGREFIDSADHGRQLQSAANFDMGSKFIPETFNPTEAGSRFDGAGSKSTSVLHGLTAKGNVLSTNNRNGIGDQMTLGHKIERLQMRVARSADLALVTRIAAVGDEIHAKFALRRLDSSVGLTRRNVEPFRI